MANPSQASTFILSARLRLTILVFALAGALMAQPTQAQTFTILHNFTGGSDGFSPTAGLTLLGTGNLFGGAGPSATFRIRQAGQGWVFTPIFEFNGTDGQSLAGRVTFGPDGALYGATSAGGLPECSAGCGVIFSMRPPSSICRSISCPWTESVLYQFDPRHMDGYGPTGGLTFDASGNIYGTTSFGGVFGGGTVFQLSPSQSGWTETVLYNFHQRQMDGTGPNGNLVIDREGNIIGTTVGGGSPECQCGVVFQLTHTAGGWTETVLHSFTLQPDGADPSGGLISDAAGNLYGGTEQGGSYLGGSVYELVLSNGGYFFQSLYSFQSDADFEGPVGILAIDSNGRLYGATFSQGSPGGNVFKLTPGNGGWTYTDLHDFGVMDGENPLDGPTLDSNGNLYGTTSGGGTGQCNCGVVYQIVP